MADSELRKWERRAGNDPDARALFLAARVRAGLVDRQRVKARAKAGEQTAGRVMGSIRALKSLDQLADLLFPLGRQNLVAAMLPACTFLLNTMSDVPALDTEMVDAVRTWFHCPCKDHRTTVANLTGHYHFVPKKASIVDDADECRSRAIWCMARTITTKKSKRIRLLIAKRSFHFARRAVALKSGISTDAADKLILDRVTAEMQLS